MEKEIGGVSLKVYCDSQLVVNQVKDECATNGEKITVYLKEAKALAEGFKDFQIEAIPRESNKE